MNNFRFVKFLFFLIVLSVSFLSADSATKKICNIEIKINNLLKETEELIISIDFYLSEEDKEAFCNCLKQIKEDCDISRLEEFLDYLYFQFVLQITSELKGDFDLSAEGPAAILFLVSDEWPKKDANLSVNSLEKRIEILKKEIKETEQKED